MLPREARAYKHVLKCQLNARESNQQVLGTSVLLDVHTRVWSTSFTHPLEAWMVHYLLLIIVNQGTSVLLDVHMRAWSASYTHPLEPWMVHYMHW